MVASSPCPSAAAWPTTELFLLLFLHMRDGYYRGDFLLQFLVLMFKVGDWRCPITCFQHVVDTLTCWFAPGGIDTSDIVCFYLFWFSRICLLVCLIDCLNYLSWDHLLSSDRAVGINWKEQRGLGSLFYCACSFHPLHCCNYWTDVFGVDIR